MGCTRTIDLVGNSYLTDAQWDRVKSYLPEPAPQPQGGRPPHSNRACLEGILFVLLTGCQWEKLPKCFPSPSTCWQRFDEWTRNGSFEGVWFLLLNELDEQGKIDWSEAAADAWFARAKKGVTARQENQNHAFCLAKLRKRGFCLSMRLPSHEQIGESQPQQSGITNLEELFPRQV